MSNVLIDIKQLNAGYDEKVVLKEVSLEIYERDFLGIIGPNGGGKTTLIRSILGLIKPSAGTIEYKHPDLKNRIGYMPQSINLDRKFPILVHEVVESGLLNQRGSSKSQQKEQVRRTLHEMDIEELANNPISDLSGGQWQRTLLGRAIVNDPLLLILDEPSSYIDKRFERQFYGLLKQLNERTAIILVSHDLGTVLPSVKNIACVNETMHYHPGNEVEALWLEQQLMKR